MGEYFIGADQIRNRISCLNENYSNNIYGINIKSPYDRLMKSEKNINSKQIMDICLENWKSLNNDTNIAFEMIIEAYDHICFSESISPSIITNYGNIIAENVVPKVRDGKQAQSYIKRKLGQLKAKISTKIKNNIKNTSNVVQKSIDDAKTNFNNNTNKIKDNVNNSINTIKKEDSIEESFQKIFDATAIIVNCDRVLENYNKISKRFNIDRLLYESIDVQDFIIEYCRLVDTYNISNKPKMIITIETALYTMNKNHAIFESNDILKYTTDYFLSKEDCSIEDAKYALDSTLFYDIKKDNIIDIRYITEFDPDEDKKKLLEEGCYSTYNFNTILENDKIDREKMKKNAKDIFNKFKALPNKTIEGLKSTIKRMYSSSDTMIIQEVPNILSYIRTIFVAGTGFAINPIVGVVVFIADQSIAMAIKRKETEKMLDHYKKEKDKANKKMQNIKNPESKKRYEEYIKGLDKSIQKIDDYYRNLLSENENNEKDEEKYSSDDFDIDFEINDDEWKIESVIDSIYNLVQYLTENDLYSALKNMDNRIITNMNYDSIDHLSKFISNYGNDIDDKFLFNNLLEDVRDQFRSNSKYIMVDCLNENINMIKKSINKEIKTLDQSFIYAECLKAIYEVSNTKNMIAIDEASFTNTLVLASEKLKKSMIKMSDTEKNASKSIDLSVNNIRKAAERAVSNDNREAIIKGSILPSSSKILKLALGAGLTSVLVSPVLAVIGVLGYIGCSAKMKSKERQLVLDEIEIELKMVDRYIRIAEDKNDLKAQRELLKTQRELERQHQRIKYKMKVEFNQNVPEISNKDDD